MCAGFGVENQSEDSSVLNSASKKNELRSFVPMMRKFYRSVYLHVGILEESCCGRPAMHLSNHILDGNQLEKYLHLADAEEENCLPQRRCLQQRIQFDSACLLFSCLDAQIVGVTRGCEMMCVVM